MLAEFTQKDVLPPLEENQVVYVETRARRGYGDKIWRRYIYRIVDGEPYLGQIRAGEWIRKLKYNIETVRHIKMESRKIWKPSKPRIVKKVDDTEKAKSNGAAWRQAALEALAKPIAQV